MAAFKVFVRPWIVLIKRAVFFFFFFSIKKSTWPRGHISQKRVWKFGQVLICTEKFLYTNIIYLLSVIIKKKRSTIFANFTFNLFFALSYNKIGGIYVSKKTWGKFFNDLSYLLFMYFDLLSNYYYFYFAFSI